GPAAAVERGGHRGHTGHARRRGRRGPTADGNREEPGRTLRHRRRPSGRGGRRRVRRRPGHERDAPGERRTLVDAGGRTGAAPMSAAVILDAGPVGLLTNPNNAAVPVAIRRWLANLIAAGRRVILPEIADFEVRR